MNKYWILVALLFLPLATPSVVHAQANAEYMDGDLGLLIVLYAPTQVKPFENFTIRFQVYPAFRDYDLNLSSVVVELQPSVEGDFKYESLFSNFILEKGNYRGLPAVTKNITFKAGYDVEGFPGFVICTLRLYYAPLNSTNMRHVSSEFILTWSSSSTYKELRTDIKNKENIIETYQRNTLMLIAITLILVGAICLLSIKYLKKASSKYSQL